MSFLSKKDYYGLSNSTTLVCTQSDEGATASVVEVKAANGSIAHTEVFGEKKAPSCTYQLKGDHEFKGKKVGGISVDDTHSFAMLNLQINTGAGSAVGITASGEQVEDGAVEGCTFAIPEFKVFAYHHAQILFNAFTLTGSGCHLQTANYNIQGQLSPVTKDGVVIAHDVINGKITVQISVMQSGSAVPVIAAGEGWHITSPLSQSNPDSNFPTYACTLTKNLAKDE